MNRGFGEKVTADEAGFGTKMVMGPSGPAIKIVLRRSQWLTEES
jgi:hypothetical protein